MAIFDIGPDGIIFLEALIVSAIVALLAWRRVGLRAGAAVTALIALALVLLQGWWSARHSDQVAALTATGRLMIATFTIVPSALLLGASRLRWFTRHAWVLLLIGPILFVSCFVGICEVCSKAGLLGS